MASGGGWLEVTLGLQASLGQRDLKLGCSPGTRHFAPGMQHPQDKAEGTLKCYSLQGCYVSSVGRAVYAAPVYQVHTSDMPEHT